MDFKITLVMKSGQSVDFTTIMNLTFTKERYTSHTLLSGKFISDKLYSEVRSVALYIDGKEYHYGIPDKLEYSYCDGMGVYSFSSRGYSCALSYNQLTPGLYSDVTISSLLQSNILLPYVSYEETTSPINYVFVKDNDTMWDAACAFSRKYAGDYPYIYGANTVRVTRATLADKVIASSNIVSISQGQDYTKMISDLHMRDLNGEYNTYNLTNYKAFERSVTRHRHISFDRQWLSEPDEAMQSVLDYSMRGMRYKKVCYCGFSGEELRQPVSASSSGIEIASDEISKLMLKVSPEGVFTTLWFYEDGYTD